MEDLVKGSSVVPREGEVADGEVGFKIPVTCLHLFLGHVLCVFDLSLMSCFGHPKNFLSGHRTHR